ncbi:MULTISPECIES: hypothetical protein [Borreliella]|uniref:hypothetical protein n=3 Tax=Borreliella TaxID=64895 RepID=UPI0011D1902E|nr:MULTISPECIES: hypothetical protein [Borreliella]
MIVLVVIIIINNVLRLTYIKVFNFLIFIIVFCMLLSFAIKNCKKTATENKDNDYNNTDFSLELDYKCKNNKKVNLL